MGRARTLSLWCGAGSVVCAAAVVVGRLGDGVRVTPARPRVGAKPGMWRDRRGSNPRPSA
ncbi:hypothetical protein PUN4_460022 [Paraburkholderia unamae]|nr:hypothetical protein PUN4_460022 [Paraburkholderia unamae]